MDEEILNEEISNEEISNEETSNEGTFDEGFSNEEVSNEENEELINPDNNEDPRVDPADEEPQIEPSDEEGTPSGFSYEYPIFDQTNQEITNPDLNLGYLRKEQFTTHTPMVPEVWHYKVKSVDFANGEIYTVESENDPHIVVIDAEKGIFNYKNLEGEEEKVVVGQVVTAVIDSPMIPAKDEVHTFYRYILYTEEELAQREFLINGPVLLAEAQETIDDLLLTIAELVGGAPEEEEVE